MTTLWRQKSAYAQDIGVTEKVLSGWVHRYLKKGLHYKVIGHQTLFNTKEMAKWIQNFGGDSRKESTLTMVG